MNKTEERFKEIAPNIDFRSYGAKNLTVGAILTLSEMVERLGDILIEATAQGKEKLKMDKKV